MFHEAYTLLDTHRRATHLMNLAFQRVFGYAPVESSYQAPLYSAECWVGGAEGEQDRREQLLADLCKEPHDMRGLLQGLVMPEYVNKPHGEHLIA